MVHSYQQVIIAEKFHMTSGGRGPTVSRRYLGISILVFTSNDCAMAGIIEVSMFGPSTRGSAHVPIGYDGHRLVSIKRNGVIRKG
jgi:hypothetical protein